MKTKVFSIVDAKYSILFEKCIESQIQYSKKNGFLYELLVVSTKDPEVAAWTKIRHILDSLIENWEVVAFIDSDCAIKIDTPNLEDLVVDNYKIASANGKSGRLNSGFFVIKNCPEVEGKFRLMMETCEIAKDMPENAPYENGHFIKVFSGWRYLNLLDHNVWNNNSNLSESCYVQHYSGGPLRSYYLENNVTWIMKFKLFLLRIFRSLNSRINKDKKMKLGLKKSIESTYKSIKKYTYN